jgi:multicomponent Na+:H+ antiporter subunit D
MTITPNPGFLLLVGALLALILPRPLRGLGMVGSAVVATYLIFQRDFGAGPGFDQIGLTIEPLRLDPLSQVFGLGFTLAALILALFSFARATRIESVSLMMLAAGAATAAFAGDLVSFVAGVQICAFSSAMLVFCAKTPSAASAGVRAVSWHALGGALMAAGVGLSWAATGDIQFERLQARSLEGALLFTGLLVIAGAPLAHTWFKDAVPRAGTIGGAALCAFPLAVGAYALARAFPGEPILLVVGAALALGALPMALLSQDVRQAAGYGVLSQAGAAMAMLGVGTTMAVAAAAALSFAAMLHNTLALLALGLACERTGLSRTGELGGLWRTMPFAALFAVVAGLSALAAPGLAGFAAMTLASDAAGQEERLLLWLTLTAASAGAALHIGARLPLAVFFGSDHRLRPADATFPEQLAMGLVLFFILVIGVSPDWLYGFLPEQIFVHPYDWEHVTRHAQLVAFALLAFAALQVTKLLPKDRGRDLADIDWFWRGPGLRATAALGSVSLAAYGRARQALQRTYDGARVVIARLAKEADRPAAPDSGGLVWPMIVLAAAMGLLFAFQG